MARVGPKRIQYVAAFCAAIAIGVATVVMVAWFAEWPRIIQPLPESGFMTFNTALSLFFFGWATVLLLTGYRVGSIGAIIPPALLSLLTLTEYLFEANIGLDELFVRAFISHPTAVPGRTAPNTTVAILLGCVVVVNYAIFQRHIAPLILSQMLAVAILTSAVCAMVGHAIQLEPLAGWYGLTHMASHTALCLALLSIALLILGRSKLQLLVQDLRQHVAGLALAAGLMLSIAVWQTVYAEQVKKWDLLVHAETDELADRVESSWTNQIKALERHVQRWDFRMGLDEGTWRQDAQAYIRDYGSLLAFAYCGDDTEVLWIETSPATRRQFLLPVIQSPDAKETIAAARSNGESRLSTSFTLNAQQRYVIGATSTRTGNGSSLVYVFDVKRVIERAITNLEVNNYRLRVLENGKELYSTHRDETPVMATLRSTSTVALAGLHWQFEATPTKEYFDQAQSAIAQIILLLGVLTSLTLGWSLRERGIAYHLATVNAETTDELEREIATREEIQQALSEREEHIRTLLQSTSEAIYGIDLDGNCTFCNVACIRTLGYSHEEDLLGKNMHAQIHHSYADGLPYLNEDCPVAKSYIEKREVHVDNEVFWRADGTSFPVEYWSHSTIRDGEVTGAVIAFSDITVRKTAADALLASEERFDLAVRGASDGLWDWNMETGHVWYSPRYLELLGYTDEIEFPANMDSFVGAIHPDDRDLAAEVMRKHLDDYDAYDVECRLQSRSGTYLYFRSRGSCVRTADGRPYRMAGALQDVTKRRELLQELNRLNHSLHIRTHELEQRNQEVEAFVYIVSHDLRAPLVNIQGFCNELEYSSEELRTLIGALDLPSESSDRIEAVLRDDIPGSLKYITAGTNRFERLINALLRLSRTGRQTYTFEQTEIQVLLERIVESLTMNIENAGATVTIGSLPNALADSTSIEQVFSNLLVNALAYLRQDVPGIIEVGGYVDDDTDFRHYWIRDNGMGIPDGAREKVFQVFQRAHPGLADGEGMGLAIVKRIIERHGGEIWVESEVGSGTTFHFRLAPDPTDILGAPIEEKAENERRT